MMGCLKGKGVAHIRQRTARDVHFLTSPFVLTWGVLSGSVRLDLLAGFLRGVGGRKKRNQVK